MTVKAMSAILILLSRDQDLDGWYDSDRRRSSEEALPFLGYGTALTSANTLGSCLLHVTGIAVVFEHDRVLVALNSHHHSPSHT